MDSEDIEKIRAILKYRGRHDLAELLRHSTSRIRESSTYGSYLNSPLSTFEIYSPVESYEKLKNLSEEDKSLILDIVHEIHPPRAHYPDIENIEFHVHVNSEPKEGLVAYCTHCNTPLKEIFQDVGELIRKVALQRECDVCGTEFGLLDDGRIWNLKWKITPSKEEYIIKLLEEMEREEQQVIFCYEDLGPNSPSYRYPTKRIKFHWYERTGRASPAYALNIYDKDTNRLEKSYCFDSPYALLQIAREAIKGYKWLKYGKKE